MIIQKRSLNHILNSIKLLNLSLVILCLMVFSYHFIAIYRVLETKPRAWLRKERKKEEEVFLDLTAIGKGALSLSSEIHSFPFPDLSRDVLFLARNTRPDATIDQLKMDIGLRGNPVPKRVTPNQRLYLSYDEKQLNFSKDQTPLWIEPIMNSQGEVWLKMGIELTNSEGDKLLNEVREFKVDPKWRARRIQEITDPELKQGIPIIEQGKWWGPDKLFEEYGGEEYQKFTGHQRFEIEKELGKEILFLHEGEIFIWKEGQWVQIDQSQGYPMAKVTQISPHKLEWSLWDREGMESVVISFKREKDSPIALRIEDVFTKLRKRTSSRISCRIDNRAKILKEGDWLVHTNTGWHTVKHFYEVEALLNLEIFGDLFVFDGVHMVDGKEIFTGSLFNSMRTEMKPIRLPLSQIKGGEHSPHTKNSFSAKIGPLAHEENSYPEKKGKSDKKFETIEDLDLFEDD
ncbi:MAG: hypothetical protein H7A38_01635 [Chlamydiales bacterium]|nr:hypothetical protein [Chlamydiales bacterium]